MADRAAPPFQEGDFVWCFFPFRETPDRPGPLEHVAYCLLVDSHPSYDVIVALYATSVPRSKDRPKPRGVIDVTVENARRLGQARGFTIDTKRIAFLPCRAEFFSRMAHPGYGVVGRAPGRLRDAIRRLAQESVRTAGLVEFVGPKRPGR